MLMLPIELVPAEKTVNKQRALISRRDRIVFLALGLIGSFTWFGFLLDQSSDIGAGFLPNKFFKKMADYYYCQSKNAKRPRALQTLIKNFQLFTLNEKIIKS